MRIRLFKITIFFIAMVYVFSTIGVQVIAHYCGGELEEVAIFSKPDSCCSGDEPEDDGCCKNEVGHVAFQKDFTYKILIKNVKAPVMDLPVLQSFKESSVNVVSQIQNAVSLRHFQPPDPVQKSIVSVSVIRI